MQKFFLANGNYYDGQWSKGLKHGEGTYVFCEQGLIMDGIWIDGIPKVSEIKYLDADRGFVNTKHQLLMPKVSVKNCREWKQNKINNIWVLICFKKRLVRFDKTNYLFKNAPIIIIVHTKILEMKHNIMLYTRWFFTFLFIVFKRFFFFYR